MKTAVLGVGTVGKGVCDILGKEVVPFDKGDNIDDILKDDEIDIVVETIGGTDISYEYAKSVIKAGKHFVTANKALVEAYGFELNELARAYDVAFLFTAACGGAIPFLYNLHLAKQKDNIVTISGILNGTTNYMLDAMQTKDVSYEDILKEAQDLGYAEKDPTADVSGMDSLRKIVLAYAICYDVLPKEGLLCEGIEWIKKEDIAEFKKRDLVCRLMAVAGAGYCYVQPVLFDTFEQECNVKRNYNMAKYVGENAGEIMYTGQGAGRYPTASNVVRDVVAVREGKKGYFSGDLRLGKVDNSKFSGRYYVRTKVGVAIEEHSVQEMHQIANKMREKGEEIFFAAIN